MPIHDWTRVKPGIFHDFHQAWITELRNVLNSGLLPADYYALCEQVVGLGIPDVLTLEASHDPQNGQANGRGTIQGGAAVAVAVQPPQVKHSLRMDSEVYRQKSSVLTIRQAPSDDRVVALIEIVSPGNKASEHAIRSLVTKAVEYLLAGVHLLIVDLHPPGPRDPQGIHPLIWRELGELSVPATFEKPLTLAAYVSAAGWPAYIEPAAIGDELQSMPLFLTPDIYVPVPLEATYCRAYAGLPQQYKRILEAPPG